MSAAQPRAAEPRPAQPHADAAGGQEPRQVLVTRPAAEAAHTATLLRSLGWQPVLAPVLRIQTRPLRLRREAAALQAVLVTSGQAPAALPATLHAVRLLAVGDATAARARESGFVDVASAGRDAAALLALTVARCVPSGGPLLLATAEGQGRELVAGLRARGFVVLRRVVYASRPVATLPAAAGAALAGGGVAAALFFSPASGRAFATAIRRAGQVAALRPVTAAAISAATADALSLLPWRDIRVASSPNQDELLACLR